MPVAFAFDADIPIFSLPRPVGPSTSGAGVCVVGFEMDGAAGDEGRAAGADAGALVAGLMEPAAPTGEAVPPARCGPGVQPAMTARPSAAVRIGIVRRMFLSP
jgi:hypothetical protein